LATIDTSAPLYKKLSVRFLPFWIAAPYAPQWTALEEYQRPDSGTIVKSKPLYIGE
jgi:hypothetical protein